MNLKVKISQTRCVLRITVLLNLAQSQSQSVPGRPLLAPIYRWPGPKEPGSIQITTSLYDTDSRCHYDYAWAWLNGPQGYTDNGLY
jgi:hypothetical protein